MEQKRINKFTDDELITQYKVMPVLSKLAHHFNVPDVTVWRRCKKLGLEFKIGGFSKKINLQEILNGDHPTYQTLKLKNRLIKEKVLEDRCVLCNINEWQEKKLCLQLDHIDGNNHNHKIDNLRLLCPNCHSQTDTWCGKKK